MITKQKLFSKEEIEEIEIDNRIKLMKNNYSNYSKPKSCSEKSVCWLCSYWKNNICKISDVNYTDEDLKIINFGGKEMLKELAEKEDYITKDELIKISKTYGINREPSRFDKVLASYKKIGLIEPSIMKSKASLGILGERGTVGFYRKNTPKILYTVQSLQSLGIRLTLQEIKYFITLLRFFENQKSFQKDGILKKLDILNFIEIKQLKKDDTFIKKILLDSEASLQVKQKVLDAYQVYNCEISLSKWDIFEEMIRARAYIELLEPYKNLDKGSLEFLEIDNVLNNPAIETNIDEIEDINQAYITASYSRLNKKVIFTKDKIEIQDF